jgi:FAD binding domain-containing protein
MTWRVKIKGQTSTSRLSGCATGPWSLTTLARGAGYLLPRAGVEVLVLEKHGDFLQHFRADTIHPSTLEVMHELELLDEFLKLPHQKVYELNTQVGRAKKNGRNFLPRANSHVSGIPETWK